MNPREPWSHPVPCPPHTQLRVPAWKLWSRPRPEAAYGRRHGFHTGRDCVWRPGKLETHAPGDRCTLRPEVTLVVVDDNDEDFDCAHDALSVELSIRYEA